MKRDDLEAVGLILSRRSFVEELRKPLKAGAGKGDIVELVEDLLHIELGGRIASGKLLVESPQYVEYDCEAIAAYLYDTFHRAAKNSFQLRNSLQRKKKAGLKLVFRSPLADESSPNLHTGLV